MTKKQTSKWVFRKEGKGETGKLSLVDSVLRARGLDSKKIKEQFLNPKIEEVPTLDELYDTETASDTIIEALKGNKTVFIHGDYDCDGICATAILWEYLFKHVAPQVKSKSEILPYIPKRIDQGYGLSSSSLDEMISNGAQLIITVDCGIRDKEIIEQYLDSNPGLQIIVTDHHLPPKNFTPSEKYELVHQLYPSKSYAQSEICGSAIALLLGHTIMHKLGGEGILSKETPGLDLVALATVTDLMPLTGINRTLVKFGLEQINLGLRLGLKSLLNIAGVEGEIDTYHLGYIVGPRINATGRIGDPIDAVKLLLTHSRKVSDSYASKIDSLNSERQQKTEDYFKLALSSVDKDMSSPKINFVVGEDWHEGIIGLVASKLTEYYSRPSIVILKGKEIKGSARSLEGIHITNALEGLSQYLVKYGGHSQAAGFTVKGGMLEAFKSDLLTWAGNKISSDNLKKQIKIDVKTSTAEATQDEIAGLNVLKPFGMKNPSPVFFFEGLNIKEMKTMGKEQNHIKIKVSDHSGGEIDCVIFNCIEDTHSLQIGRNIDAVGSLSINTWNSYQSPQLKIREWRFSDSTL